MRITLIAVGKVKGAYQEMAAEYVKRLSAQVIVREIATQTQKSENAAILAALPPKAFVVALDERGKDLTSRELAGKFAEWTEQSGGEIAFVIGGADGLLPEVKARAKFLLGLGRKTWPHKLVRVMLFEQLYRAQQILAGHPYHRD